MICWERPLPPSKAPLRAKKCWPSPRSILPTLAPPLATITIMDEMRRTPCARPTINLVQAIIRGDEASFYDQIAAVEDRHKVCGFSSIYLMLRYLQGTEGVQVAYDHCPADDDNHSLVSIAGILLE